METKDKLNEYFPKYKNNVFKKIKLDYLIIAIFSIFAIVFLVCSIYSVIKFVKVNQSIKNYTKTQGNLIEIKNTKEGDEEKQYKGYSYTVNGQTYMLYVLNNKVDDFIVNEKVKVIYNKLNPNDSRIYQTNFNLLISCIFLALLILDIFICYQYYNTKFHPQYDNFINDEEANRALEQMNALNKNYEKVLDSINNSKDKLFSNNIINNFKSKKKYKSDVKDSKGNMVAVITPVEKSLSKSEEKPIDAINIEKEIARQLNQDKLAKVK